MENQNKALAAISYIGILCLVTIFCAKDDAYARFHANQGLILWIVGLVNSVIAVIPVVGWIISGVVGVACFVFMILGIINAVGGKMQPLPLIGGIQILK